MKNLKQNQKGFTLVELLAVIVILGVIAAIAVPAIGNVVENSKLNSRNQSILLIRDAAELYYLNEKSTAASVTVDTLREKGYLRSEPVNPVDNNAFETVNVSNTANGYRVTSVATSAETFTINAETDAIAVTPITPPASTTPTNP